MPITFLQFCKIFRRIANFYILDEVKALDEFVEFLTRVLMFNLFVSKAVVLLPALCQHPETRQADQRGGVAVPADRRNRIGQSAP